MQTKSENAPAKIPAHRRITNYDETPIRDLLARLDELCEEKTATEKLMAQRKHEVEQLQKKTKFTDKKQLETLSMFKLQLDMCPGKLDELEVSISEVKKECDAICQGRHGFLTAVSTLVESERKRIMGEIIAAFLPACIDELEARELAKKTHRIIRLEAEYSGWNNVHSSYEKAVRKGLAILDQFESGTLDMQRTPEEIDKLRNPTGFASLKRSYKL